MKRSYIIWCVGLSTVWLLYFLMLVGISRAGDNVVVTQVPQLVVKQRVVQFDPNTFLGTQGYYSHGENLRVQKATQDDAALQELKEQNRILRDLVNAILKNSAGNIPTNPGNPTTPVSPTTPTESVPVPVPVPIPVDNSTELQKSVLKIFTEKCIKCHGDTKADGGLKLVSTSSGVGKLENLDFSKQILIHHRTNGVNLNGDAKMPKGSPGLSDEEVETLRMWMVESVLNSK